MALFIASGQYQITVRRRRTSLARRWQTLRACLATELDWPIDAPPGGVSLWLPGPPGLDGGRLAADALRHGVVIERGDVYYARPEQHRNCVRLGFAAIAPSAIVPGIAVLAALARRQLAEATATADRPNLTPIQPEGRHAS